jgi:hypothetical protein
MGRHWFAGSLLACAPLSGPNMKGAAICMHIDLEFERTLETSERP